MVDVAAAVLMLLRGEAIDADLCEVEHLLPSGVAGGAGELRKLDLWSSLKDIEYFGEGTQVVVTSKSVHVVSGCRCVFS